MPLAMAPPGEAHGRVQAQLVYLLTRELRARASGCAVVIGPGRVQVDPSALPTRAALVAAR